MGRGTDRGRSSREDETRLLPRHSTGKVQEARERALQRKLEGLRDEQHIEAADYNFILRACWVPNDPKFGDPTVVPNNDPGQWGLKKATTDFTSAWNDARGDATRGGEDREDRHARFRHRPGPS